VIIHSRENVPLELPAGTGIEQLTEMTGSIEAEDIMEDEDEEKEEKKGSGTFKELF